MQHPLVNPSLTPFGFVLPNWKHRLEPLPKDMINGDREMSLLWAASNRLSEKNRPAELLINEILPSVITVLPDFQTDFVFDGREYQSRDILVLSSFMAWLGTNVGQGFVKGSIVYGQPSMVKRYIAYDEDNSVTRHVLKNWSQNLPLSPRWELPDITDRDRALVRSIMYWLNRKEGKAFMESFTDRCGRLYEVKRTEWRKQLGRAAA